MAPPAPAFSPGLMPPASFEGEGAQSMGNSDHLALGFHPPSPSHACLWACPVGRCMADAHMPDVLGDQSRCSLHPPFTHAHTHPCASQKTYNLCSLSSVQDIFLPFLCLLSKPPFVFGTPSSPGHASGERHPLLPLTASSGGGVSGGCLAGFPSCFPASGICHFLGWEVKVPVSRGESAVCLHLPLHPPQLRGAEGC